MTEADRVYQTPLTQIETFRFDERVARVFPDMIGRSVPGYALLLDMMAGMARSHVPPHGLCYDLGCSLGAVSFALRRSIPHSSARIIGIDNSEAMITRASAAISRMDGQVPVEFIQQDITQTVFKPCHLVVLNFTLQFIPRSGRAVLLQKIYQALQPGGMLILTEKITSDDETTDALLIDLHHDFKRNQGYSDLEIAQKRTALENVLLPDTARTHLDRLSDAGFQQAAQWFQCFNFAAFLAIRTA